MKIVPLGEVATIERVGVDPSTLDPLTAYLGLEHIERGGRIVTHGLVGRDGVTSTKFTFGPDHILFGKLRPNLGKVARPTFSGVCSTDILPIRVGDSLDAGYLLHYLRQPSMIDFASSRTSGANLPRLSPAVLATFPIPLPGIEEQRRIAAILDQAEDIRTKRRQALAHLDGLPQVVFRDLFSEQRQQISPLGELAEVASGITKGRRTAEAVTPVPYLAVANVQDGFLSLDSVKTIDATAIEIDRYALREGDLLMTEGGDPDKLGRGAVWRGEISPCLHQNHIFRVRVAPSADVVMDYLAAFVASPAARRYFLRSAKQTTGIASINMGQLRRLPVPLPPMKLQRRFAAVISNIASYRERVERQLAADDELFASLQARAFRGEL